MNISYNWLRQYIETPDDAQTVARILTDIGLEVGTVETVETIRGGLKGVKVGQVMTCEAHPNSDHLHICQVDLGDGQLTQIVCGSPNVAAGQKVLVATIGTILYQGDESFTIKRGKLRGEESLGMICAEDELGVGTSHDGIMVLPADTPVGMDARDYFHIEDDTLIEVDITPNRNDGASHYGVARDLYAYYKAHEDELSFPCPALRLPDVSAFSVQNHNLPIQVTVEDTAACPRYTGVSISGVTIKESPKWLQDRLQAIGLRSINNVVDVTNFVLMELGQALHAFDADKIGGQHIVVRKAKEGTPFVTLDGIERKLSSQDLMICDEEREMCIAGVFGGKDTGVSETTRNIFLESAYFNPVTIRKTARRHGLSTDASFRYERGCDPNFTMYVLKRAALLIQEVAGGEVAMEIADVVEGKANKEEKPFPLWQVDMNLTRVENLIGKQLGAETIEKILTALEIRFTKNGADYHLEVPRYRVDVQRECDVAEDILRIYGYNNVAFPEKVNTSLSYSTHPDSEGLKRRLSEQLTAQGFHEILNNSLTKVSYYERGTWLDSCVKVKNPLSSDLGVMRQTLLFGGLESIQRNINRKMSDLRLYEFGNCYFYNPAAVKDEPIQAYSENLHLALWLTGNKSAQSWVSKSEQTSFYQLHAYVNNILLRLGIDPMTLVLEPAIDPDGDKCCGIVECFADGLVIKTRQGLSLGYMAAVSRQLLREFDIEQPVYYADLYWQNLMTMNKQYKPVIEDLPKYPSVKRDLALLLDKDVCFADLEKAAFQAEKKLLHEVNLFDVYEGKNLEAGKKSYALSFILQDKDNTLKDQQIEHIMDRIRQTFEKQFNARLR